MKHGFEGSRANKKPRVQQMEAPSSAHGNSAALPRDGGGGLCVIRDCYPTTTLIERQEARHTERNEEARNHHQCFAT